MTRLQNRIEKLEATANPKSFGVLIYDDTCENAREIAIQKEVAAKAAGDTLLLISERDAAGF